MANIDEKGAGTAGWRLVRLSRAPSAAYNALVGRLNRQDTLCELVIQNGSAPVALRVWQHTDGREKIWYDVRTLQNTFPAGEHAGAAYDLLARLD